MTPWARRTRASALDDDVWELYDTTKDWSQAKDLAKEMPEKLHELQRLWLIEATRYKVLPLDDRLLEKMNPDIAGRPVLIKGKTQILFGGMGRLSENCVLNIKNKSHSVTAEIVVPEKGAEGVIIAQGANIGGWSLYAKDGKLKYCYNWGGFKHFYRRGDDADSRRRAPGAHGVRLRRRRPGQGRQGRRSTSTARRSAKGTIDATLAMIFSADDGCDVGEDTGAPVSPDYGPHGNAFNGRVKGVQLAIAEAAENADHLVDPETPSASPWRGSRRSLSHRHRPEDGQLNLGPGQRAVPVQLGAERRNVQAHAIHPQRAAVDPQAHGVGNTTSIAQTPRHRRIERSL